MPVCRSVGRSNMCVCVFVFVYAVPGRRKIHSPVDILYFCFCLFFIFILCLFFFPRHFCFVYEAAVGSFPHLWSALGQIVVGGREPGEPNFHVV